MKYQFHISLFFICKYILSQFTMLTKHPVPRVLGKRSEFHILPVTKPSLYLANKNTIGKFWNLRQSKRTNWTHKKKKMQWNVVPRIQVLDEKN